jgi:Protein of unknown function (DUF998)
VGFAAAFSAPVVLIVSTVVAGLLRSSAYHPITQTISALGSGASDVIMTAGIVTSALYLIITAAGLYVVPLRARIPLGLSAFADWR